MFCIQSFDNPIGEYKTPWDYLTSSDRLNPLEENLKNAEQSHFQELVNWMVINGVQDTPIMEVIPRSSIKTGVGVTNKFDQESSWKTEMLDITD